MKKRSSEVQRVAGKQALAMFVVASCVAASPQSPYTDLEEREIKALSPDQIEGYETGQGMGLALAAELNGYPGPKHVLELENELGLQETQVQDTEKIFNEMKQAATDLGRRLVEEERDLDRLFASHVVDSESLSAGIQRISDLEGRLRATHLQAHLEMMGVLTAAQVDRYIELRGYHGGEHGGHQPGHTHDEAD